MYIKEPFKSDKLFFVSDTHFGHKNIIRFDKRISPITGKLFETVEEMEDYIIDAWNSVVTDEDTIFMLGDFFYRCSKTKAKDIISRLKGKIYWVKGNHDDTRMKSAVGLEFYDRYEIWVDDEEVDDGKQNIILEHFAMLTWPRSHRGSWHLFGHSHGSLEHPSPAAIDVGVSAPHSIDFKPISYEEVKIIITQRYLKK